MQLTIAHGGLSRPLRLPADLVIVQSDAGTVLGVLHEWGPAGWTFCRVGDPDFEATLAKLGIDRTTFVDRTVPVPTVALLDSPR